MAVTLVSTSNAEDAVDVLCEAFRDYPVMRHVLGSSVDYDRRLHSLIGFFVTARLLREEPVLGTYEATGELVAAATVTLPGERSSPPALAARREAIWAELGQDARGRYEAYGAAAGRFTVPEPHHHLNMIGIRRSHQHRGFARRLLEAVHEMARTHAVSSGVSLSTETESNVTFYRHLGYRLLGCTRVADEFESCAFFRSNEPPRHEVESPVQPRP